MKRILPLLLFFFINLNTLFSQNSFEKEFIAIHPKFGMAYTHHLPDFNFFNGLIPCGYYGEGSGWNISGFLIIEKNLFEDAFAGIGLGFIDRSSILNKSHYNTNYARNTLTGEIENVKTENVLDIALTLLEIQPEIRYTLIDELINGPLRLMFAGRISFPMSKYFKQEEKIIEPDYASFIVDNKYVQSRLLAEGNITTINSPLYGISAGIENLLKVSNKHFLSQQILFDYNINNIVSDAEWKFWGIRLELGLRLHIAKKDEPLIAVKEEPVELPDIEPVPKQEPEPLDEPDPELKLSVINETAKIYTGNELISTQPVVNAIFFNKDQSRIPEAYFLTGEKEVSWFYDDPIELHYHIIPKVIEILNKNPKATVTIKSYTSSDETGGLSLAKERAISIKNALVEQGLPSEKIKTTSSLTPENPSTEKFEEGSAENRRADIIVNNAFLQEYVSIQKYAEVKGEVEVKVEVENLEKDKAVKITSDLNDKEIELSDDDNVKFEYIKRILLNQDDLEYSVNAMYDGIYNNMMKKIDLTNAPREVVELNLENFLAVLTFEYDRSELSNDNKELLKQLVELLPENRTILISGSADKLGSEERNRILEGERATNTINYIRSVSNKKINIEKSNYKYNVPENTPQGRFINRSISLRIR